MKNLLNPKWIIIINTLPIILLFFMFYGQFNIIKTLLKPENIRAWIIFSGTLAVLSFTNFIYAVYLIIKKKQISILYGFIALLVYIPFIYIYGQNSRDIIPWSIPRWMIFGEMILYVGTFLMPTLVYSLFILAIKLTAKLQEQKAWKSFAFAIVIPAFWYLFSQVILPLWKPISYKYRHHVMMIFVIIGTLIFLFFLIRGIYIIASKKSGTWKKYELAWKIPITIVFPLLGLALNNGLLFNTFSISETGVFGNFTSIWYYLLAIINGVLLCLPNYKNKTYRIILFLGRVITFTYTFYFFMVFIPFLPLSIVAIIVFGAGFLMLSPLLLFIIHINELSKDFSYLKTQFTKPFMWIISFIGIIIIPLFILLSYQNDKKVLNKTLDYVYTPDYSKNYNIDTKSLQKTLNVIKLNKDKRRNNGGIFGTQTPYLSTFFKWIVLDNLTLSDKKINTIEKIFFNEKPIRIRKENIVNKTTKITNITTKSTYDNTQKAWRSWINLEITNSSDLNRFAEYATTINLPIGSFISNYYLYVGDRKEMGILAEKKSAMWVFNQIRNTNRDPGILYYLTGNKVAFRVFPFAKNEVRKTGIEILHKEPIELFLDDNLVKLGDNSKIIEDKIIETDNVIYVTATQKEDLKTVERKPYFHFLVDVSNNKKELIKDYKNSIQKVLKEYKSENSKISFVSSYTKTIDFNNWKTEIEKQPFKGSFFLDRAIKKTLINSHNDKTYPILIVVTDSIDKAILKNDFADFKNNFPENDKFYNLHKTGIINAHSLINNSKKVITKNTKINLENTVLEYNYKDKTYYLPNDNKPNILLKKDNYLVSKYEIKKNNWKSALAMQGMWKTQILHPETSHKGWLQLVKYSFMSKVMSPVTSFIVVENEAQKAMLKKKQEQVLNANKSLDVGEDRQRMSEPSTIILILIFILILFYRERRKRKLKTIN
ncbi:MAG TPA: MSEP-CTERM sorting domain-containing protein [Flavobacteriaceae bacterium]|nr:MSEP-CTERM sorting domain-containing protein [Flavobacteriaceae bacterium]